MKVILAADVHHLGRMGDLVEVANGYARNFLLPKNLATTATLKNVRALEHQKRVISDQIRKEVRSAEGLASKLGGLTLSLEATVGEEGKLFGSISSKDISEALAAQGFEIEKRQVLLEKPIKEAGAHHVSIKIRHDVNVELKIDVVAKAEEQ